MFQQLPVNNCVCQTIVHTHIRTKCYKFYDKIKIQCHIECFLTKFGVLQIQWILLWILLIHYKFIFVFSRFIISGLEVSEIEGPGHSITANLNSCRNFTTNDDQQRLIKRLSKEELLCRGSVISYIINSIFLIRIGAWYPLVHL